MTTSRKHIVYDGSLIWNVVKLTVVRGVDRAAKTDRYWSDNRYLCMIFFYLYGYFDHCKKLLLPPQRLQADSKNRENVRCALYGPRTTHCHGFVSGQMKLWCYPINQRVRKVGTEGGRLHKGKGSHSCFQSNRSGTFGDDDQCDNGKTTATEVFVPEQTCRQRSAYIKMFNVFITIPNTISCVAHILFVLCIQNVESLDSDCATIRHWYKNNR